MGVVYTAIPRRGPVPWLCRVHLYLFLYWTLRPVLRWNKTETASLSFQGTQAKPQQWLNYLAKLWKVSDGAILRNHGSCPFSKYLLGFTMPPSTWNKPLTGKWSDTTLQDTERLLN